MSRLVLFHYHLFKNAGTSVDKILHENFGSRWVSREFEERPREHHLQDVTDWIEAHPEALAFSSHTAQLPPPRMADVQIVPILFVRHPLDRIVSAYQFERRQGADAGFGAELARSTTLDGYVRARLALQNDRQCRNFHVDRFARMFAPELDTERDRAMAALQAVPFVGIVEAFDRSMAQLRDLIEPEFPDFKTFPANENVSRAGGAGLEERLQQLRETLGDELCDTLVEANAEDMVLYRAAQLFMMAF